MIIVVVLMIVVLAIGVGLGMVLNSQTAIVPSSTNTTMMPAAIKDLSSKVIPSITAYGAVFKIDGKNLTLAYQGDSATITVADDAKIYALVVNDGKSVTNQINFSDLKIGDNVSVNIKVLPDGKIQGTAVIVLPPPTPAPGK